MTAKELAGATNISNGEISKIEHGNQNPSFDFIERLADALEVSLDYLAGREDADLPLPEALARQSLRIFQRQATLTSKQERYVQKVAETKNAPQNTDEWRRLVANVALWRRL